MTTALHATHNATRHSFPDELMSWASLLHFPPIPDVPAFARGRSYAVVMAAYLGSAAEGDSVLRPLRRLSPERDTFATVPTVVLGDLAMDPLGPGALPEHLGATRRDAARGDRRHAGRRQARNPGVARPFRCCSCARWAARSPAPRRAPARATLPGDVSMFALGAVFDEPMREAVHAALAHVDAALQPYRAGYYPNFVEEPADASAFFDPATWARLQAVKAAYDPRPTRSWATTTSRRPRSP